MNPVVAAMGNRVRLCRHPCGGDARALLALALVLAACSTAPADGAEAIEFLEVHEGEDWPDLAVRLGCSDSESVDDAVDHLRAVNPVAVEVGLERDQVLSYDPDRLLRFGCGERVTGSEAAAFDDLAGADVAEPDISDVGEAPDTGDGSAEPSDVAADIEEPAAPPVATLPPPPTVPVAAMTSFIEDFETEESMSRFEFSLHHPVIFAEPIREWLGDHDTDCGPPPTTRTILLPGDRQPDDGKHYSSDTGGAVFRCAPGGPGTGHLMTTFDTIGYAQIGFSPRATFDDVSQVCWDQNMTDLGNRKWTQLVIVTEDEFEAAGGRLDFVSPDLDEGPASLGTPLPDDAFLLEVRNGSSIVHSTGGRDTNFSGYKNDDKKRRFTTCVSDLGDGTVDVEFEREEGVDRRTHVGEFPDGPVRVIFQDDTYNAPKSPPELDVDAPFTWHWDNIVVETG